MFEKFFILRTIQRGTFYHKFTHVFLENRRYPIQILTSLIFVGTFENTQWSQIHAVGTEIPLWTDRQTDVSNFVATVRDISKASRNVKMRRKGTPV